MDEIQIYRRDLSASEVLHHHNLARTLSEGMENRQPALKAGTPDTVRDHDPLVQTKIPVTFDQIAQSVQSAFEAHRLPDDAGHAAAQDDINNLIVELLVTRHYEEKPCP